MPGSAPRSAIIRSPAVATILQGRCCDGPDRKSAYAKSQPCVVPVLMCHAPLLSKSPTRRRDKRSARFNKSSNTGLICGGLQPKRRPVVEPGDAKLERYVPYPVGGSLADGRVRARSEEHTSELQSLMRISYAVFCLK